MNSFNSNRLSESANPYLKQHSGNPIFWQEWNKETFEYAKKINKPIFLSIGYATCHWCHVMAHESFEDDEVAKILNERFVSIKVDREERPDIDQTYMSVCQMISGHGGWPLTIVMSPSQEPFFAATYIPKHSKHGKAGLIETLTQLSFLWENEPDRIQRAANAIKKGYSKLLETKLGDFPSISAADRAASIFSTTFDTVCGGFGRAPNSLHLIIFYFYLEIGGGQTINYRLRWLFIP